MVGVKIQKSLENKMLLQIDWIEMIWTLPNEFEMFKEFIMTKRTLKTVL